MTEPLIMSQAQELAAGWIPHFFSADRSIKWLQLETEMSLWLDDQTLLVGKVDAQGVDEDGETFFADWKTISGKKKSRMAEVKASYRLDPQMLTYGVLVSPGTEGRLATQQELGAGLIPQSRRFMVRWAMKTSPPLYFHEWYRYGGLEIEWWRNVIRDIATRIRADRATGKPFVPNITHCLKYGQNYPCPFLEPACSKQNFDGKSEGMVPRISHLDVERRIMTGETLKHEMVSQPENFVLLDATRIRTWLECNERYRRVYVENVAEPPNGDALQVGSDFHSLMDSYYTQLKEKQNET